MAKPAGKSAQGFLLASAPALMGLIGCAPVPASIRDPARYPVPGDSILLGGTEGQQEFAERNMQQEQDKVKQD